MTDTRIAYIAASGLRVVAGDGTGDHLLDAYAGDVPPAWDPTRLHTLAYYSGGAIVLRQANGRLVWRAPITVTPADSRVVVGRELPRRGLAARRSS